MSYSLLNCVSAVRYRKVRNNHVQKACAVELQRFHFGPALETRVHRQAPVPTYFVHEKTNAERGGGGN
jgi:hypothetical protein